MVDEQNKVVDGMMTDSLGHFRFSNVRNGSYRLIIKFIGYHQKEQAVVVSQGAAVHLGVIGIRSIAAHLREVTVRSARDQQTHSLDRQTFQASAYKNTVGGTALDIVINLPSAAVDANGGITLRGNAGILVLVNGKPSLLDPATALSQIAANDVTEVEYITNPSAQFDPDGKGGFTNIKTRKASVNGFAWVLNLQGGLPSIHDYNNAQPQKRFGGDIGFQFKKDKWEWSAAANYLRNDNAGFRDGDVSTTVGNRKTSFPSQGERGFDKYNYGVRINTSWQAAIRHHFNLGVLASRRFQDRIADIYYQNQTMDLEGGQVIHRYNYFNPNLQNKQGEFYLLDLSYDFKMSAQHSFQLGGIYEHARIYGSTRNGNIYALTDTVQWTVNRYTNPLNGTRFSVQHTWNLPHGTLISGYQRRNDEQKGNFDYLVATNGSYPLEAVPEFTGKLNASNAVDAFFTQFLHKTNRVQWTMGLRYEYY